MILTYCYVDMYSIFVQSVFRWLCSVNILVHIRVHSLLEADYCTGYSLTLLFWLRFPYSPGQENQQIFKAAFPIDSEATKAKVAP